ncbi:hypothetical protein AB1Y20_010984 [Prymnesium parvum]|uniref:Response regulatory domain-containing protein n=1 Tax=Prymnesium parvum TaxID=97485 RepID=A0AB34IKH9_PRYPA
MTSLKPLPPPQAKPRTMHPITLRFYDEEMERALCAASHSKLVAFNTFALGTMGLLLLVVAVQQQEVVSWGVVLFLGLSIVYYRIRHMDAALAHMVFQSGIAAMLAVGVSSNVVIGFGLVKPQAGASEEKILELEPLQQSCPVWAIAINLFLCVVWTLFGFWLHLDIKVKMMTYFCPIIVHAVNPMYAEAGSTLLEVQLIAAGLSLGCVLGYVLELNARQSFLESSRHLELELRMLQQEAEAKNAKVRASAYSVINHTAKRVMCSAVQICELAIARLEPEERLSDLRDLFSSHRIESVRAFHLCRSVLFRSSVEAGEYVPQLETFHLDELLRELAVMNAVRFQTNIFPSDAARVHCDKQLLLNVLFGAAHNALVHGRSHAIVHVRMELMGESLCLKVRNEPGANHDALLRHNCPNFLESNLLSPANTSEHTSFLQLRHIKLAAETSAAITSVSLCARRNEVVFELNMIVELRGADKPLPRAPLPAPLPLPAAPPPAAPPPAGGKSTGDTSLGSMHVLAALPEGMLIVHADDDMMPRMFMQALFTHVGAGEGSLILGEEYDALLQIPRTVAALAKRVGHERVIVVLDQNLELPGHSLLLGSELCRQLRQDYKFDGVVVILSANDEQENVKRAASAGADALVAKGLNADLEKMHTLLATLYFSRFSQRK